jgi:hypothetical protein
MLGVIWVHVVEMRLADTSNDERVVGRLLLDRLWHDLLLMRLGFTNFNFTTAEARLC